VHEINSCQGQNYISLNTLAQAAPHHREHNLVCQQRYTGRRATYAETHLSIAALVSDRAARRTTRHRHRTDIVLARQTSC
jgi:hypothetical protein